MNKRRILGIILIFVHRIVKRNLNKSSAIIVDYFNSIEEISPINFFLDPSKIDPDLLIGQIVIPSIELNLTIFKGVSNNTLATGFGTMKS